MKFDFIVLGATGMQGKITTKDLLKSGWSVLMCGRDKSRIKEILKNYKRTAFEFLDVRDKERMIKIIKNSGAKVLINCVEGDWNLAILKACIKSNIHSIDLGSDIPMTRKQFKLDRELKNKKLIHITGCGSVPGIGNVMLKYAFNKFDIINTIHVGFAWDSNIKKFVVPFSIESILEELTANAPYLHNHMKCLVKPLNSVVKCYHRRIGFEKEFKVGHHPETYTFHRFCEKKKIQNIEFYAGFPDHSIEKLLTFVEMGLGSKELISFNGTKIKPIEFLKEVLKKLKIPKGYTETENLWVYIKGKNKGKTKEIKMECIVPPLKGWEDAGCNIDTGMPASIIAQMIFKDIIKKPGSYSPEFIVPVEPFFKELRKRKMLVYENGKIIN